MAIIARTFDDIAINLGPGAFIKTKVGDDGNDEAPVAPPYRNQLKRSFREAFYLRRAAYGVPVSYPFSRCDPVNEPEPDYFEIK